MDQTARNRSVYLYGPKSFLALILISFGFVALPLIFALVYSAFNVEQVAEKSQSTVYHAVKATQDTRILVEQLTEMERAARQYHVLGDDGLLRSYEDKHRDFLAILDTLRSTLHDTLILRQLQDLGAHEAAQHHIIAAQPFNSPDVETAIAQFAPMADQAHSILADSGKSIDREVDGMREASDRTVEALLWLSFAMIPIALIFSGVFTVLLNRPIKQIDQAIRRLGTGELAAPVAVTGPRNLEYLGQRLEWLRERLQDVEDQKIKFIRHVSHELKTPLTALREGTELLADEVVGGLAAEQREIVQILRQNGIRLQILIEDLLNFNTAATQSRLNTINPVHLDTVIRRVVEDHKLTIAAKNIGLDARLAPCVVEGDMEKLRVIVDNLLSNAIKYSPSGGTITLMLREEHAKAVLDVYDSGPGIQPEEGSKIFETFYQGTAPTEGHIKGSGLGLSIAREHVLAHQGVIEALFDSIGAHLQVILPQKQMNHVNAA